MSTAVHRRRLLKMWIAAFVEWCRFCQLRRRFHGVPADAGRPWCSHTAKFSGPCAEKKNLCWIQYRATGDSVRSLPLSYRRHITTVTLSPFTKHIYFECPLGTYVKWQINIGPPAPILLRKRRRKGEGEESKKYRGMETVRTLAKKKRKKDAWQGKEKSVTPIGQKPFSAVVMRHVSMSEPSLLR